MINGFAHRPWRLNGGCATIFGGEAERPAVVAGNPAGLNLKPV